MSCLETSPKASILLEHNLMNLNDYICGYIFWIVCTFQVTLYHRCVVYNRGTKASGFPQNRSFQGGTRDRTFLVARAACGHRRLHHPHEIFKVYRIKYLTRVPPPPFLLGRCSSASAPEDGARVPLTTHRGNPAPERRQQLLMCPKIYNILSCKGLTSCVIF